MFVSATQLTAPLPDPNRTVTPGNVIHDASAPYAQLQTASVVTVMVLGAAEAPAAMSIVWLAAGVKV
jgi:hypothetical protein